MFRARAAAAGSTFVQSVFVVAPMMAKAFCFVHVTASLVAWPQICDGWSMFPTLDHTGEMVLVVPMAYWRPGFLGMKDKRPERGDIVVATNIPNPAYTVAKRVIGVEGDVIEIEPTRTHTGPKSWAEGRFCRVPKGHVWIVGDNLSNSTDSRDYGPVPLAMVKGKVTHRIWHRGWPTWTRMDSNVTELGPSPHPPLGSVKPRSL